MNNHIQHHGIKGQKWGVRRFQNKDGSLTSAGKKRYTAEDFNPKIKDSNLKSRSDSEAFKEHMTNKTIKSLDKEDIDRIKSAKSKWLNAVEESNKAEFELFDMTQNKIDTDLNRSAGKSKEDVFDEAWKETLRENPELEATLKGDRKVRSEYLRECEKVTNKIIEESNVSKKDNGEWVAKTKHGEEITISKNKRSAVGNLIQKLTKQDFDSYTAKNSEGKKVGTIQLDRKSEDEMNIVWMDTKSKYQGRGYASSILETGEQIAKEKGASTLTAEVVGNSPDMKHIVDKRGYGTKGELKTEELMEMWGGLTLVELDLKKKE